MKVNVGDIIAIPIQEHQFVFGRVYNDATIAIYDFLSSTDNSHEVACKNKILMFSGFFDSSIKSQQWKIVGHISFLSAEEAWAPPVYIQDILDSNKYRIYHKGVMESCSKSETLGMERQVMRKPEELIEAIKTRLMVEN
ncbi:Imm26 family immunity protein [Vibrio vulnificus]|uniref:Imm26 family immunity protein n=1 Tax=Vibrio vulnificus TaxID=672 RepID=UPI0037DAAE2A